LLAVALVICATVQVVALAWIAAWQQKAALEVRRLNGAVVEAVRDLAPGAASAPRSSPPDLASFPKSR
jgi:hypothetical protein